jgi:hypothetical protein
MPALNVNVSRDSLTKIRQSVLSDLRYIRKRVNY